MKEANVPWDLLSPWHEQLMLGLFDYSCSITHMHLEGNTQEWPHYPSMEVTAGSILVVIAIYRAV